MKVVQSVNLPTCWSLLKMTQSQVFCCWKVGHSSVVVATPALVNPWIASISAIRTNLFTGVLDDRGCFTPTDCISSSAWKFNPVLPCTFSNGWWQVKHIFLTFLGLSILLFLGLCLQVSKLALSNFTSEQLRYSLQKCMYTLAPHCFSPHKMDNQVQSPKPCPLSLQNSNTVAYIGHWVI